MTNDKELIERLALEAAQKHIDGEILSLADIAKYAIAAYLAERGKEAVGTVRMDVYGKIYVEWKIPSVFNATSEIIGKSLFPSPPAIPEGMALFGRTEDMRTILPPAVSSSGIELYAKEKP